MGVGLGRKREWGAGRGGQAAGAGHLLQSLGSEGKLEEGPWVELGCFSTVSFFCKQHSGRHRGDGSGPGLHRGSS